MEGLCQEKVNILKMWFICGETGLFKGKTVLLYSADSLILELHLDQKINLMVCLLTC